MLLERELITVLLVQQLFQLDHACLVLSIVLVALSLDALTFLFEPCTGLGTTSHRLFGMLFFFAIHVRLLLTLSIWLDEN